MVSRRTQRRRLQEERAPRRDWPAADSLVAWEFGGTWERQVGQNPTAASAHQLIGYCGCLALPHQKMHSAKPPLLCDPTSNFPLLAGSDELLQEYARRLNVTLQGSLEFVFIHTVLSLVQLQALALDETAHQRFWPIVQAEQMLTSVEVTEQPPQEPLNVRLRLAIPLPPSA